MTVSIATICYRAPHLTPEQFKTYFEETHVPLLLSLVGPEARPVSYKRHYFQRGAATDGQSVGAPVLLWDKPEAADFDAIGVVQFEDEAHMQKFATGYYMNREKINEDEAKFFDVPRLVVGKFEGRGF